MISLVVQGGAWDIPDDLVRAHRTGVQNALKAGWAVLLDGGGAVDAVEEAIVAMENDETFNAGRGSCMNSAGQVELDAGIMDGTSLGAGAVAAVQNVPNPIRLARALMAEGSEVFLVGMGAVRFAREHQVKTCSQDDLITAKELERWRRAQDDRKPARPVGSKKKRASADTVGAVAMDRSGHIAAGTSTGGPPGKYPGRVGDSPLIGAGVYADNATGGVSASGMGEQIMKVALAKTVIELMGREGGTPEGAAKEGVKILRQRVHGSGGVIVMSAKGEIAVAYNTLRMARAYLTSGMKTAFVGV